MANEQLLHVASPSERNTQQTGGDRATSHATGVQQTSLKALSGAVLGRNNPCNTPATVQQKACNNGPQLRALSVALLPAPVSRRDRAELSELIALVSQFHGFTEAETQEARDIAAGDVAGALTCFRSLAQRFGLQMPKPDDRVLCGDCSNRIHRQCQVAAQGLMADSYRGYTPVPDVLRNCEHYTPRRLN